MRTQWKRRLAMHVITGLVLIFSHAAQTMDIAPMLGEWRYKLCQPLTYISLYVRECTLWEEGEWVGTYSGGCINKQNPFPWSDESLLIPKSLAFYGDLSATWHGWLGEGEKLPYNGCWVGPPRYQNGVEISNVSKITTQSESGTDRLFAARRDRSLTCPAGYVSNGSVCRPTEINPHKNNEACVAGLNGSNPIHTALGYKLQTERDYVSRGPEPLEFTRRYSSGFHWEPTPMGRHWRHTYVRRISALSAGGLTTATVYRQNGDRYYFNLDAEGRGISDPDVVARLERLTDSDGTFLGWQFEDADGVRENYDPTGRLVRITDRDGRALTLSYDVPAGEGGDDDPQTLDRVRGALGRSLEMGYDARGRLDRMTDPAGGIYRYAYDANDNLISVSYPDETPTDDTDNPTRVYHYEEPAFPHALTGITDENGNRYATWAYDEHGRAIRSEHAGGAERVQLTYHTDGSTTVTDAMEATRTYTFQTQHGVVKPTNITGGRCAACGALSQATTYDANGFIASRTDWNGNVTTYVHNDRGLQTSRTEAVGTAEERTIATEWHNDLRLPTKITAPGKTTEFRYDAGGRLERRTERDTETGGERSWHYTYTAEGLLASVDGPRTDVADSTQYDYDNLGNRIRSTNALGQVTEIPVHDAHGRPLESVDPNGVRTTLTYDVRGRLRSRTVGAGLDAATTRFDYDAVGNLKRITLPDNAYLDYEYDAAQRLTAVEDNLGNRIEYELDASGNRRSEKVYDRTQSLRRTHGTVYNQLNRLIESVGAYGQSTHYGYDGNGNRLSVTDALNRTTTSGFDALDRLIRVLDAEHHTIGYGYDARDNLTSVTDPRGLTTVYRYDGLDNRLEQLSPDTGTTAYTYDAAGNRLSQTDARGVTTRYTYDALNRLESVRYPDGGLDVSYTYDQGRYGVGRLTGTTDASGTTTYRYDARGNLAAETTRILGVDYITGYRYDAADRLTRLTYPSGRTLDYARDAAGRVIEVTTTDTHGSTQTVATDITHLPFGPIEALSFGNGLRTTQSYDLDARITEQATGALQALRWEYDAVGNITDITDTIDPHNDRRYAYDDLNRLTAESGVYGRREYAYDALGNRTRRLKIDVLINDTDPPKTRTQTYTFADESNRLTRINRKALTYGAAGNTSSDRGGKRRYAYDESNRLAAFTKDGTLKASYHYNGHGERVIKRKHTAKGERTTIYHYDPDGRLIAETRYNTNGIKTSEREYLWLEDRPLAQITTRYARSGTISATEIVYLHPDHLNTPRLATDQNRRVVWRWDADAFGQGKADRDPDGDGHRVAIALRFPGQYKDPESGLHYNYFRDYDPTTGRYIESDPIGLRGGLNTYGYANQNPGQYNDFYGLDPWVGASAGGRIDMLVFGAGARTGTLSNSITGETCFVSYRCFNFGIGALAALGSDVSFSLLGPKCGDDLSGIGVSLTIDIVPPGAPGISGSLDIVGAGVGAGVGPSAGAGGFIGASGCLIRVLQCTNTPCNCSK